MGLSKELFFDRIDEEFICPICLDVLEQPIQDNHDHLFCKKCIETWLNSSTNSTCPLNRQQIMPSHLKPPSKTILNLLSKLRMKCKFSGCIEMTSYEHFTSHFANCELNPRNYILCEKDCKQMIKMENIDQHNCLKELANRLSKAQCKNEDLISLLHTSEQRAIEFEFKMNLKSKELELSKKELEKERSNNNKNVDPQNRNPSTKPRIGNTRRLSEIFKGQKRNRNTQITKLKWNPSTMLE